MAVDVAVGGQLAISMDGRMRSTLSLSTSDCELKRKSSRWTKSPRIYRTDGSRSCDFWRALSYYGPRPVSHVRVLGSRLLFVTSNFPEGNAQQRSRSSLQQHPYSTLPLHRLLAMAPQDSFIDDEVDTWYVPPRPLDASARPYPILGLTTSANAIGILTLLPVPSASRSSTSQIGISARVPAATRFDSLVYVPRKEARR